MKIVNSENRRLYRHIYDFMGKKKFPYITLNILCLIYDATAVLIYSYLYKMIFNSVEYNRHV